MHEKENLLQCLFLNITCSNVAKQIEPDLGFRTAFLDNDFCRWWFVADRPGRDFDSPQLVQETHGRNCFTQARYDGIKMAVKCKLSQGKLISC